MNSLTKNRNLSSYFPFGLGVIAMVIEQSVLLTAASSNTIDMTILMELSIGSITLVIGFFLMLAAFIQGNN